jgi:hypothetical protein
VYLPPGLNPASRHSELFTTATRNFEWRVLASTPALESLQLARQYPREFPTTLTTMLASSNVTSLVLEIRPCPVDWRFLDELFASAQFKRLHCVSFVDWMGKENVLAPDSEVKLLMPQNIAREIVVTRSREAKGSEYPLNQYIATEFW